MIRSDTRAVSIALNYTIAIGITTLLTTGLIIGAGNLLDSQEQRVARQQADEIGADLLSQADRVDRLNEGETTVQLEYPSDLVGNSYTLSFQNGDNRFGFESTLRIESQVLTGDAVYPVPEGIDVENSTTPGERPVLRHCPSGNITLGGC